MRNMLIDGKDIDSRLLQQRVVILKWKLGG